jgi:ferric-dicitrate binding protein FerR (iron transport regulator)
MKKEPEHITSESTIVKFLNDDLSEAERENFNRWLNEASENKKLFEEIKKIWIHSENINDLQLIDTKGDWAKVKKRMNFEGSRSGGIASPSQSMIWVRRIAAVFVLLIGIGFLAKQFIFHAPDMIVVNTGDYKEEIVLPDGSSVYLNKYSQLEYPEKFQRNRRAVSLTGEGYFEVIPNPDKLFRISIDNQAIVEVLGTSFNIRSQKEIGSVDIRVVSGKVAFFKPDSENNKTLLIKDEQAALQDGTIFKESLKDINFLSWKTGILVFDNESIENVFNELTSFYNKTFTMKNKDFRDIRFTSKFDNQDLDSVLEEIKLVLNLNYTLAGDTIIFNDMN